MFAEISRRLWVFVVVSTPLGALAQAAGTPGGLEKPKAVLTTLQTVLLGLSGILVSVSLIGCGIAMAFCVAGLVASGGVIIEDCANVATSFPGFVELANGCGFAIR